MEREIKNAIEEYQCSGCINGGNTKCFIKNETGGVGCGKHYAGTMISGIGTILLGMPKGFNRLGASVDLKPNIYKSFDECDWKPNMWNVPVWKYLSKDGHTFVRGVSPRLNAPYIHIFLENCIDKIDCLEITENNIINMD